MSTNESADAQSPTDPQDTSAQNQLAQKLTTELQDLAVALAAEPELHEGLYICLEAALHVADMDMGGIYLLDDSGGLYLEVHKSLTDEFVEEVKYYDSNTPQTRLVAAGEPIYSSGHVDGHLRDAAARAGVRGIGVLPFSHSGEVIGSLNVASRELDEVPTASRHALEAVAAQVGSAIARLRTAEALRKSEEKYRLLAENMSDVIVALDRDLKITYVSPSVEGLCGFAPEEVLRKSLLETVAPESKPVLDDAAADWRRRLRDLETPMRQIELHILCKDGSTVLCGITASRIFDDYGQQTGLVAAVRDISQQRRAEDQLTDSEGQFQSIVEASPMGMHIYELRPNGKLVFAGANKAADMILGVDNAQFIGKTIEEAFPPLVETEVPERYKRAAAEGEPWKTEQIIYEDQRISGAYEVYAFQTRPEQMAALFLDVTERKQADERERRQRRDLALLSETAMAFVRFGISDDMHRFVADKLREIAGPGSVTAVTDYDGETARFRPHTFAGLDDKIGPVMDLLGGHPSTITFSLGDEVAKSLSSGRLVEIDTSRGGDVLSAEATRALAESLDVRKVFAIAFARGGKLYGAAMILVPPHGLPMKTSIIEAFMAQASVALERRRVEVERSKIEEQLIHVQKMEAIGTLAGGVAHDFNNLLTCIRGYADLLQEVPDKPEQVLNASSEIGRAARSAFDLTQQLLGFAHKGQLQVKSVDVHVVIGETLSLLGRAFGHSITLVTSLRAARPVVYGDPGHLQQVVMNIMMNARDALGDGGEIMIESDNVIVTNGPREVGAELAPGEYLKVSIIDNGSGIPEDVQRRIFEPFFTTKERGKGTGMGLAMVYGMVKNHGGGITVRSEPEKGSTFSIFLPATTKSPRSVKDSGQREAVPGSGCILVVDDEDSVRGVIGAVLEQLGYEVVLTANGREAADYYAEHSSDIDLVLLDLDMPVMNGQECFKKLKETDASVKVVVATGYDFSSSAQDLLDNGVLQLIHKPLDRVRLSEVVSQNIGE